MTLKIWWLLITSMKIYSHGWRFAFFYLVYFHFLPKRKLVKQRNCKNMEVVHGIEAKIEMLSKIKQSFHQAPGSGSKWVGQDKKIPSEHFDEERSLTISIDVENNPSWYFSPEGVTERIQKKTISTLQHWGGIRAKYFNLKKKKHKYNSKQEQTSQL